MTKAFDKVSHIKLLARLHEFGFGGSILKWFGSYLTNRYQQTTVLGAVSRSLPVSSGVPQGSILGPLLFLLYENHLSKAVTNPGLLHLRTIPASYPGALCASNTVIDIEISY